MAQCACSRDTSPSLSDINVEERADQLKALASPVRLRMVRLIHRGGGEICVCEFMEHCDLSQPTISHHLKVLREAGLVKSRKDGTYVYHRIDDSAFAGLSSLMNGLATPPEDAETESTVTAA